MFRKLAFLVCLAFAATPAFAFRVELSLLVEEFKIGEPTYCWLVFTNDSKETVYLLNQPNGFGVTVTDDHGQVLRYQGPMVDLSPAGLFDAYQPGETRVVRFDLQSAFDLSRIGRYVVRFRYPNDTIERIFEHGDADVPMKATIRQLAVPDAPLVIVDSRDPVADLLRAHRLKARHEVFGDALLDLAPAVLEHHPQSPYAGVARLAMVRRLLLGLDEPGTPTNQRLRRASDLLEGIPGTVAPTYARSPVALYLLEKAVSCNDTTTAKAWIAAIQKDCPGKPPAQAAQTIAARIRN